MKKKKSDLLFSRDTHTHIRKKKPSSSICYR